MFSKILQILLYAGPVVLILRWYIRRHTQNETSSLHTLISAKEEGLLEPPTLHPEIDHRICIGHEACKIVCPVNAITLAFGTATRGIEIPQANPEFQTNVPGVFIAGELGGTVAHFPRRKVAMTEPADLPIVGKMRFKGVQKETLIDFWQDTEQKTGIQISYGERVDSIEAAPQGGFIVQTDRHSYDTRSVLLSIGRRGTPRKLGVPGEETNKVVYRVIDAAQYCQQHVLVVGGGDSALEAATSIAAEPGTNVTLSYRSGALSRAKLKNRNLVESMESEGRLRVLLSSNVRSIREEFVEIELKDAIETKWGTEKRATSVASQSGTDRLTAVERQSLYQKT